MFVTALAVCLGFLAGCDTLIPLEQGKTDQLTRDLQLAPDSIVFTHRCNVGQQANSIPVPFVECVFVGARDRAVIVDYDPKTRRYIEMLRVTPADQVALATQKSVFGTLAQLQLRQRGRLYVVVYFDAGGNLLGHLEEMKAAFAHLRAIGVAEMPALPVIHGLAFENESRGTIPLRFPDR